MIQKLSKRRAWVLAVAVVALNLAHGPQAQAADCESLESGLNSATLSLRAHLRTNIRPLRNERDESSQYDLYAIRALNNRIEELAGEIERYAMRLGNFAAECASKDPVFEDLIARIQQSRVNLDQFSHDTCSLHRYSCRQIVTDHFVGALNVAIDLDEHMGWAD